MDTLNKAIELKQDLDKLRPLGKEDELRIMQKFRLDWNYHSSNLEGNTLTYGETKALILFGTTAQGKPLKDHFEITGHNEVINWILDILKEERPLTENFIRQLHEILLKEPYEVDAITPEGEPTKKLIEVGKYKRTPNHVKTKTGEIFRFASPEETPAMMQNLLEWYSKAENKNKNNPILEAAEFHYRFIRIHPFDDGNGRLARILMNFILMKHGYPPVIVKTEDKENYFSALRQADAGILTPFFEYITINLIHSLEIMISGAKGESVEEKNDLDKELAFLRQMVENTNKRLGTEKSIESMKNILKYGISSFVEDLIIKSEKFRSFYLNYDCRINIGASQIGISSKSFKNRFENIINSIPLNCPHLVLDFNFTKFYKKGFGDFNHKLSVIIKFNDFNYVITTSDKTPPITLKYSEFLDEKTANEINKKIGDNHKQKIETAIKKIEKKK